ncbi:MAG: leucyl/phenylalanyl-tRNA--protein transferase [Gammaproteobacteria bacterium]|nr:leucyl/phenylalanyl-tRNA--protein transferase [Gammaproteobacteria bacterium]
MTAQAPFWLDPQDARYRFPDPGLALREPNGLLALGGDLSPQRLLAAYRKGIFPWYNEGQPILWWSPEPRAVLYPDRIKVSRSLRKTLKKKLYTVTMDQAFDKVINACAAPRKNEPGTWILAEMKQAYCQLHQLGYAHSVECWNNGKLVGGLYGVAIGKVFFGESMFSRETDASKVAFVHLAGQLHQWEYGLIDGQVSSAHLTSLGAEEIPRQEFLTQLEHLCEQKSVAGPWQLNWQFGA